jgi:hypothetical protein
MDGGSMMEDELPEEVRAPCSHTKIALPSVPPFSPSPLMHSAPSTLPTFSQATDFHMPDRGADGAGFSRGADGAGLSRGADTNQPASPTAGRIAVNFSETCIPGSREAESSTSPRTFGGAGGGAGGAGSRSTTTHGVPALRISYAGLPANSPLDLPSRFGAGGQPPMYSSSQAGMQLHRQVSRTSMSGTGGHRISRAGMDPTWVLQEMSAFKYRIDMLEQGLESLSGLKVSGDASDCPPMLPLRLTPPVNHPIWKETPNLSPCQTLHPTGAG